MDTQEIVDMLNGYTGNRNYLLHHSPALQHQEHFQLWQQAWVVVPPSACFVKPTEVMVSELQSDIYNNHSKKVQSQLNIFMSTCIDIDKMPKELEQRFRKENQKIIPLKNASNQRKAKSFQTNVTNSKR